MFSSMISHEFSPLQEILLNFIYDPHNLSNEFLIWIKHEHYPVVNWKQETSLYGILSQNFNTTSYSKLWIPIRLILKPFSLGTLNRVLSSQEPSKSIIHTIEDDWIIADIRAQAGKYVSRNYLYTFYIIIFRFEYLLLFFHLYFLFVNTPYLQTS